MLDPLCGLNRTTKPWPAGRWLVGGALEGPVYGPSGVGWSSMRHVATTTWVVVGRCPTSIPTVTEEDWNPHGAFSAKIPKSRKRGWWYEFNEGWYNSVVHFSSQCCLCGLFWLCGAERFYAVYDTSSRFFGSSS